MTGINSIILTGGSKTEIWPFSWEMCPMKTIEVQFGELMEEGDMEGLTDMGEDECPDRYPDSSLAKYL